MECLPVGEEQTGQVVGLGGGFVWENWLTPTSGETGKEIKKRRRRLRYRWRCHLGSTPTEINQMWVQS